MSVSYLNPQPVPPRTMAATRTAPAMDPMMMLVPLGPGEEGRAWLAGTGKARRQTPSPGSSSLTLVLLRLPGGRRRGQGVVDAAVFARPVWLTDALPFVAADLEVAWASQGKQGSVPSCKPLLPSPVSRHPPRGGSRCGAPRCPGRC